jgi:hypothetical protein
MAEAVDVSIKKNLVGAHAVALKDGSENVVFWVWVEAIGTPEGVDRKGSGRKKCDEGCCRGWRSASEGMNSSVKDETSRQVCPSNEGIGGCKSKSRLRG